MKRNEEDTHRLTAAELDRVRREIEKSHGRVFSFAGDYRGLDKLYQRRQTPWQEHGLH
jgi:hypothetical protein